MLTGSNPALPPFIRRIKNLQITRTRDTFFPLLDSKRFFNISSVGNASFFASICVRWHGLGS